MSWIKKIFSKKIRTTITSSSRKCPKCRSNGGFFFYEKGFLGINSEPFYLCEDCCKRTTIVEYEEFLKSNPTEKNKKEINTTL